MGVYLVLLSRSHPLVIHEPLRARLPVSHSVIDWNGFLLKAHRVDTWLGQTEITTSHFAASLEYATANSTVAVGEACGDLAVVVLAGVRKVKLLLLLSLLDVVAAATTKGHHGLGFCGKRWLVEVGLSLGRLSILSFILTRRRLKLRANIALCYSNCTNCCLWNLDASAVGGLFRHHEKLTNNIKHGVVRFAF